MGRQGKPIGHWLTRIRFPVT